MATPTQTPSENSRFTLPNKTTQERISSTTVGLVALSDFRKRRAEVLEQQEREARDAAVLAKPDRSHTGTPDPNASSDASSSQAVAADLVRRKKAKKRKVGVAAKLSFGNDDNDDDDDEGGGQDEKSGAGHNTDGDASVNGKSKGFRTIEERKAKFKANASVSIVPRAVTKSALRREAAEREVLRREFLARQEAVKATEIAIPFVFYDGSNIPGGVVRVKKGDFIWVFLDKSRKVGADLGVGEKANARREWARIGVDDLMMVRGNIIIPHHYEFLFFIMNKTKGPGDRTLFDYTNEAPPAPEAEDDAPSTEPLFTAASRAAKALQGMSRLEGASDDPTFTKVVDRRWYERNKHIYPASVWQEFDSEKDYQKEIRRDLGGNTFFYS